MLSARRGLLVKIWVCYTFTLHITTFGGLERHLTYSLEHSTVLVIAFMVQIKGVDCNSVMFEGWKHWQS